MLSLYTSQCMKIKISGRMSDTFFETLCSKAKATDGVVFIYKISFASLHIIAVSVLTADCTKQIRHLPVFTVFIQYMSRLLFEKKTNKYSD